MYKAIQPSKRVHFLLLLIVAGLLLVGCGDIVGADNWPAMTANGERVYLAHGPGVVAVDIAARQQLWTFPADSNPALQFYAAPSLAENGRIILGDYGASQGFLSPQVRVTIYALEDTSAGLPRLLWSTDEQARGRIIAPPLQIGNQVFVGTDGNEILSLDATSGALQWRFDTGHSIWAQPVYDDGVLYVASLDKTLYALSADSGEELWRRRLTGAIANRPAVGDNLLYVGTFDKQVHALSKENGEEQWVAAAEDWVWGSPTLANGVLYYADINGNVYAVDAVTGSQIWTQTVPGAIQADPVVVDETVYIASAAIDSQGPSQGFVTAFTAADGRQQWQQTTRAPLFTTPVVVDGSLVVALESDDALLIVFNLEDGSQQWVMPPVAAR